MRLPNSPYVDKFYQMNPETEGLTTAMYLQDGMRVLFATVEGRPSTDQEASWSKEERALAEKHNRWFTVSRIYIDEANVNFVATYEDGVQRHIRSQITDPWLVKLDSLDDVLHLARENARYEFWNALGRSVPPIKEVTPEDELMDEGAQPSLFQDNSNELGDGPKLSLMEIVRQESSWPGADDGESQFPGLHEEPPYPSASEESAVEEKGL